MPSKDTPKTSRMERGVSRTADRLASRAAKGSIERSSMPGGGEVFGGDLASRALKTLGARAMTVDNSIIVSDEFDPNRAEDQALYAHEQFHVAHSGGQGSNEARDGEEVAARAVERMVLHRAKAGGAESHEATHTTLPIGPGAHAAANQKRDNTESDASAQRGYALLVAQGLSHDAILHRLAHDVEKALDEQRESGLQRFADKKGFM